MTCPYCTADALSEPFFGTYGNEFRRCNACHRSSMVEVTYGPSIRIPPAPVYVRLTKAEQRRAEGLAAQIVNVDVARGWAMYFDPGGGETRMDVNVRGFGAELAAARATGLPRVEHLLTVDYRRDQKPPDLGERVEVRSTRNPDGFLYVYKADPPGRYALLVIGKMPRFGIVGWIATDAAKTKGHWREAGLRHPAFVVEQRELLPLPLPVDA